MSTVKLDNWAGLANTSSVRTLVQFLPHSANLFKSHEGNYISLGNVPDYNVAPMPNRNTGYFMTSFAFTPKFADSLISLETSLITVNESGNVSDDFRMYATTESTLLCWSRAASSYASFGGALNGACFGLKGVFNSWGTTAKTIFIYMDTSGSSGASYAFNGTYVASWVKNPFYVTVMEYR